MFVFEKGILRIDYVFLLLFPALSPCFYNADIAFNPPYLLTKLRKQAYENKNVTKHLAISVPGPDKFCCAG